MSLTQKKCKPGIPGLKPNEIELLQAETPKWDIAQDRKSISRRFDFKNYYETIAFVNAVAFIANREDHHPDLEVFYNRCQIRFSTHDAGGLSENDFICAAKVDALF